MKKVEMIKLLNDIILKMQERENILSPHVENRQVAESYVSTGATKDAMIAVRNALQNNPVLLKCYLP